MMIGGIQLSGPCEPWSGGRLVLGLAYSRLAPSVQAIAYSQSLPGDRVSLPPQVSSSSGKGRPPPACGGQSGEFRSLGGDGFLKPPSEGECKSAGPFLAVSVVTFARGGGAALPERRRVRASRNSSEAF